MLPQTIKVMKKLREINKYIDNALKINEFVDSYLDECLLTSQPVILITPWSLSRSFKKRHIEQGSRFFASKAEKELFEKEIPLIESVLKENGFSLNWWLVFSRSYIRTAALSSAQEKEYTEMIANLIELNNSEIAIANWEDDVICMNHQPNLDLLDEKKFKELVNQQDFEYELSRRSERAKGNLKLNIPDGELINETKFKIACEANEGLFLMENKGNPLCQPGKFLFLILGKAERYSFFSTIVPEFKKRIVCILKPYPWRIKSEEKCDI